MPVMSPHVVVGPPMGGPRRAFSPVVREQILKSATTEGGRRMIADDEDDVSPFVTDQTRVDCGRRLRNPKVKTLLDAGTEKLIDSVSGGMEHPFRFPSADVVCAQAAGMPPFVPEAVRPNPDIYPNSPIGTPEFRSARNAFDRTWPRLERYRADLAMYTLTKPAWFAGAETVLVTAGASAPEDVVQECVDYLQRNYRATVETRTVREEDVSFQLPKELRALTVVN